MRAPLDTAAAALVLATILLTGGCSVWQAGAVKPDVVVDPVHRGSEALAIDEASRMLATGGWEGAIALWSMDSPSAIRSWPGHDGSVQGVVFHGEGLITAGYDGWLRSWSRTGELLVEASVGAPVVRVALGGDTLIVGGDDGSVRLYRLPELQELVSVRLPGYPVSAVAASASGRRFAAADFDGNIAVLDAYGVLRLLDRPSSKLLSLAFSADGESLYGGGWRLLYAWRGRSDAFEVIETPHWGAISGLHYVPTSGQLASISRINDSSVFFLDPMTGTSTLHLERQPMCGSDIVVSPDGRYLATAGDDGAIRIWDLLGLESPDAAPDRTTQVPG